MVLLVPRMVGVVVAVAAALRASVAVSSKVAPKIQLSVAAEDGSRSSSGRAQWARTERMRARWFSRFAAVVGRDSTLMDSVAAFLWLLRRASTAAAWRASSLLVKAEENEEWVGLFFMVHASVVGNGFGKA